jgi:hypothetical protein
MQSRTAQMGWMADKRIAVFAAVLSLICLLGEAVYCWRAPAAYFDTMAYVALVDGTGNGFAKAGADCATELPGTWNGCGAVVSSSMFREVTAYSAADFAQMERFYTVKPLYAGLAEGLHRWVSISAFQSLRVLSVSSFLLIGAVAWAWLQEHLPAVVAPAAACLLTATGTVLSLGKDLLPDGLSTGLLLLAVYWLLYRRAAWVGVAVLALSVLARLDNMIFVVCAGAAWIIRDERARNRQWMLLGGLVAACAAASFALARAAGALPWAVLFRRSFFEMLPPARFAAAHVSLAEYAHILASNGVRTVAFCLPMALFLSLLTVMAAVPESALRRLVMASGAAIGIRVLFYPGVEQRYYVWFFLVCAISAACVLADLAASRNGHAAQGLGFARME